MPLPVSLLVALSLAAAGSEPVKETSESASARSEKVEKAYAEGENLLAAADARDLFVNETREASSSGAIVLRHKASGYRCVMNPGEESNSVRVFPSAVRGEDVACTTKTITDIRTLYFTRWPSPNMTNDVALAAAVAAIEQRYPDAKPVVPPVDQPPFVLPPPGVEVPESRTARFLTSQGFERVTVGKVGEWVVKYRFSGPEWLANGDAPLDMFWMTTVLEPQRKAASGR